MYVHWAHKGFSTKNGKYQISSFKNILAFKYKCNLFTVIWQKVEKFCYFSLFFKMNTNILIFIQIFTTGPINVVWCSENTNMIWDSPIWWSFENHSQYNKDSKDDPLQLLLLTHWRFYGFYAQIIFVFLNFSQNIFVINLIWLYFSTHRRNLDKVDVSTVAFQLTDQNGLYTTDHLGHDN